MVWLLAPIAKLPNDSIVTFPLEANDPPEMSRMPVFNVVPPVKVLFPVKERVGFDAL